jgi:hypothetical protein
MPMDEFTTTFGSGRCEIISDRRGACGVHCLAERHFLPQPGSITIQQHLPWVLRLSRHSPPLGIDLVPYLTPGNYYSKQSPEVTTHHHIEDRMSLHAIQSAFSALPVLSEARRKKNSQIHGNRWPHSVATSSVPSSSSQSFLRVCPHNVSVSSAQSRYCSLEYSSGIVVVS